jgi:hypothetical protein
MTETLRAVPAATITHTIAVIRGEVTSDVTVQHARTADARIGIVFGTALMNLYSASAAQGLLEAFTAARAVMTRVPRELAVPAIAPYESFARTTLAIEWTRRPAYCAVPQSAPNKTGDLTIHWVDLYCGPITFQIRDQVGLKSTLALLTRMHRTAVAVFLDGPQHAADPTDDDYAWPQ